MNNLLTDRPNHTEVLWWEVNCLAVLNTAKYKRQFVALSNWPYFVFYSSSSSSCRFCCPAALNQPETHSGGWDCNGTHNAAVFCSSSWLWSPFPSHNAKHIFTPTERSRGKKWQPEVEAVHPQLHHVSVRWRFNRFRDSFLFKNIFIFF